MDKKKIRKIRLSMGLDQKEFGAVLGVSQVTVCYWETGAVEPSAKSIKKILEFCKENKIRV